MKNVDVRLATLVGVACVVYAHGLPSSLSSPLKRASFIRTLGAVVWPLVLLNMVPLSPTSCAAITSGIAWVGGMWVLDEWLLLHGHRHDREERTPKSLRIDPSSVTALAFGLSGLLGVRGCDNEHIHLLLYAVTGSLVTTFVSHDLPSESPVAATFENVQRVVLVWCIGLVLVGVQLTHSTQRRLKVVVR
jgi:hypothetical protein